MSLDERLKQQNNGEPWRDCEQTSRRRHRWKPLALVVGDHKYLRCSRCPVSKMVKTTGGQDG